ncbi:MAG TPA: MqnA/MqnD/SBP family protein, partial [Saprospiraceae bacterium]|nr:MqnA/MqnD/SBP family protein [Saprospiraceae bacterium]
MSLRIATVEFLNALPFLTVLRKLHRKGEVELVEAIPSECARLLRDDEVDVALLPVGALDQFEKLEVVSRFCIGCVGPVRTVKLFSSVPVGQIKQVVLDPASRSSNQLVRILLRQLWKNEIPELVYPDKARPMTQTAYVYIGDKVFGLENQFPHEYDLGEA